MKGEDILKKLFINRNKELENEIEVYLLSIHNATLTFNEGVGDYVKNNHKRFQERIDKLIDIERQADDQLKDLKYKLYKYNLIPDFSGDVLALLDSLDDISDASKQILIQLSIEKPNIYDYLKDDFIKLAETSLKCVETLLGGVRGFFSNSKAVEEIVNRVYFYEAEVDKIEEVLKRQIFNTEITIELSERMHLRYFINKIAQISDTAEQIALKLSIFKLKRNI